ACDETTCYIPTTAEVAWTVRVVPARTKVSPRSANLFARIPFGRGEAPTPSQPSITPSGPSAETPQVASAASLDDFRLQGTSAGFLGKDEFLRFVHDAERGIVEKGVFEERGPLAILLLVLIGGLALNLTPCVLPMIPINLAIIGAGVKAGSRGRGFLLGAAY